MREFQPCLKEVPRSDIFGKYSDMKVSLLPEGERSDYLDNKQKLEKFIQTVKENVGSTGVLDLGSEVYAELVKRDEYYNRKMEDIAKEKGILPPSLPAYIC
jgi:hypothetical protein